MIEVRPTVRSDFRPERRVFFICKNKVINRGKYRQFKFLKIYIYKKREKIIHLMQGGNEWRWDYVSKTRLYESDRLFQQKWKEDLNNLVVDDLCIYLQSRLDDHG